jgi:AraC-like DNA-binding protein
MAADPLSDVLSLVRARCVISRGFTAGGEWGLHFDEPGRLKIHAVITGHCWLRAGQRPPTRLTAGDVAVLNGAESFTLSSHPGAPTVEADPLFAASPAPIVPISPGRDHLGIGGHVELDGAGRELILGLLPPVTRIAAGTTAATRLAPLMRELLDELTHPRPGSAFAAEQHAQLALVEILRTALAATESPPPPGWLRLLADATLRPALNAIHREPARPWQLADLAREAAMSRSSFATRFRAAAGEPPVAYLNRWRIRLAQKALRDTTVTVAQLATDLGYASESSFSHAFKRQTTASPRAYRRDHSPEAPPSR